MKPINIFALTRQMNIDNLQRLERQMSVRKHFLTVKDWEIQCIVKLVEHLESSMLKAYELLFYYSFQIPKLGKEFDLLRISEDTVINIELKSNSVPDEQVKKQLEQNRYYLSTLGLNMRSYTYISSDDRLLRLTGGGNIVEAEWQTLCDDLTKQTNCYTGDIEELFKEERYIISPLSEPERFLKKEYFLTSQQKDISKKILRKIAGEGCCYQGFSGLPGTGKTLLLYDLAMSLSAKQRVAIVHCGAFSEELYQLDERLKRVDFLDGRSGDGLDELVEYSAILVDEAHKLKAGAFTQIVEVAGENEIPVVFCYDSEDAIKPLERGDVVVRQIELLPGYEEYKLTNRIRANSELSAFVQCVMRGSNYNHRKEYPSVSVAYATDVDEARLLIEHYKALGYTFIYDRGITAVGAESGEAVEVEAAGRHEYSKVVMLVDEHFAYDEEGLGSVRHDGMEREIGAGVESPVRNLFHGLNRAKENLAIVVLNNEKVLDVLLTILQGPGKR